MKERLNKFFIRLRRAIKLMRCDKYVLLTRAKDRTLVIETHNIDSDGLVHWAEVFHMGVEISAEMDANEDEAKKILNIKPDKHGK